MNENYCLRMGIGRNVPLGRGPLPLYESFPAPPFPSLLILGSRRQSLGSPMSKLFINIVFALVLLFGGFCCANFSEDKRMEMLRYLKLRLLFFGKII